MLTLVRKTSVVVAAVAVLAACATGPDRRAFVERLGTDTLAVEAYTRTASRIEGERIVRSPVTRVARYAADLSPEGTVTRMTLDWSTPPENPDGPPPSGFTMTFDGTTATVERRGQNAGTAQVPAPMGTFPSIGQPVEAMALYELAVKWAFARGGDSTDIGMLVAGRPEPSPNWVVRTNPDTVAMSFFGMPMKAGIDAEGNVLSRHGLETTMRIVNEPATGLDVAALASDFAARDARGEGIGQPSPPGEVSVSSAGATFDIQYSRPRKRGREIFGSLVPWNSVWRTGANAATQFTTDRDLMIGDARVPAGTYTLWTMFTPDQAELIINSETGQWGTAYNGDNDFARVTLNEEELDRVVDQFTIAIEPSANGGVLSMSWDRSKFSVAMRVLQRGSTRQTFSP